MNKKAFTIIELIVVIVVIGILVLLATPKITGYAEKAKIKKIGVDIKEIDNLVIEDQSLDKGLMIGGKVDQATIDSIGVGGPYVIKDVYNKKGRVKNFDKTDEYYHLNSGMADQNTNTPLGGIYIMSKKDESIYYIEIKETNHWIIDSEGNFIYIGTDKVVKIPDEIQGQKVDNYSKMFVNNGVEKVIRNNQSVKDMSYMFESAGKRNKTLDVSSLRTSNVTDFSYMFRENQSSNIFGLDNFNTSNAYSMEQMFRDSYATSINVESFDTYNVSNTFGMFKESKATELKFSKKFNTVKVKNVGEMFQSAKVNKLVGLKYMDLSGVNVQTLVNHTKEVDGSRKDLFTDSEFTFKNMSYWKNELDSGRKLNITGKHEIVRRGKDNGDGSAVEEPDNTGPEYGSHEFEAVHKQILGQIGVVMRSNVRGLEKQVSNPEVDLITPKGSNSSGQIRTIRPQKRGSYDADIKLANNPGELNGFFLYNMIDNDSYEIDIEMMIEDGKWKIMTTIYNPTHPNYIELNKAIPNAEFGVIFNHKEDLKFDPTVDFHNYKINLDKNFVSFEVDNQEITRWNGQFDFQPMHLYIGSFYSHWLDANKDIYYDVTKFDADDKNQLRNSGYEAYNKQGLENKLKYYFGADKEHVMKVKNIKLNSDE